jgi:nicotinate phosphoribosyltransferase
VAAGLEQALQFLKSLSFSEAEYAWLREQGGFSEALLEHVRSLRFDGDVDAMPEGTVFFAGEPVLRITATLPLALLVESRLLSLMHFETSIASGAARLVSAAGGRRLIDMGLRRAHGAEAALLAARAAYLAGFDGTSTADASRRFGIPALGAVGVRPFDAGASTLDAIARTPTERVALLVGIDAMGPTQESLLGLARAVEADAARFAGRPRDIDDLPASARALRRLLDAAGLDGMRIFATGALDEDGIAALLADDAPVDGFALGGWLSSASDTGFVDAVYAMQHYGDGAATSGTSRMSGAPTWPGPRNVVRRIGADGRIEADLVLGEHEVGDREALMRPCMRAGKRVGRTPTLQESRAYCTRQVATLPESLQRLQPAPETVLVTTR